MQPNKLQSNQKKKQTNKQTKGKQNDAQKFT